MSINLTSKKSIYLALILIHLQTSSIECSRFAINGPSLTVKLKDTSSTIDDKSIGGYASSIEEIMPEKSVTERIIGISGLEPSISCAIRSLGRPLPKWIPFLKNISLNSAIKYGDDYSSSGNFVEGHMTLGPFFESKTDMSISVNPIHHFKERKTNLLVAVSTKNASQGKLKAGVGGGFFGLLRFTSKGAKLLEYARASYKANLPFSTVRTVTVTPSFDFSKSSPTCILEGESGTGRSSAVLDLNPDESTLTIIHALDSYNTIAPEISLNTAKIMYNWDVSLSSGGSIRTRVDPTSAIQVVWTDVTEGGKWVTDFKLPLDGSSSDGRRGIFAADICVRRLFKF